MAAFTEITNGFAPQLYMSELIDAVNERRLAAIASGATGLPSAIAADGVGSFQGGSVKPTHLLIQEMLEALAPRFVDHTQREYDDTSATDPITPFTVSTWRAAAGLNSSGFRRATKWNDTSTAPTFGYGLIQTGDIAGYWIWNDIINGLRALRWTVALTTTASVQENRVSTESEVGDTLSDAISIGDTAWATPGWKNSISVFDDPRYVFIRIQGPGTFDTYYIHASADRNKFSRAFGMQSPVALYATFVARPRRRSTDYFYDLENKAEDRWYEMQTVIVPAGSTAATMTVYSVAEPTPTPFADAVIEAYKSYGSVSDSRVILRWIFSRT